MQAYSIITTENNKIKDVETFSSINEAKEALKETLEDLEDREFENSEIEEISCDGYFDSETGIVVSLVNHFVK